MAKRNHNLVHIVMMGLIRLILFLTFIYSLTTNRTLVQIVSLIALFITFIPWILKILFNIKIPSSLEIISLMFIYGLLISGEIKGLYLDIWWGDILMTFTASIALGFIGLSVVHVLYKEEKISFNSIFASILIFSFAVSIGVLWELFEFTLDTLIKSNLQKGLTDTMQDLSVTVLGALIVSVAGAIYIKKGDGIFVSAFLTKIIEKNSWILGPKRKEKDPKVRVLDLIESGEKEGIEFKSSFRTNLHTKEFDKKMEHGVLKTVTAFLNTKGGNLLVGIDDCGRILGLEKDNFQNDDKLGLHLTNLIKNHIGNEFLPFIKFEIISIRDKKILLIICKRSEKQVFLKSGNEEEFYVRNGPASIKLGGSSLVDYIKHRF
jgi:hypothetical protein|tara:strand:- start:3195 stop:4322 length:1128 start_codon:yes stop_codon:yes gene_type:complete